jgi:hypothetical protein
VALVFGSLSPVRSLTYPATRISDTRRGVHLDLHATDEQLQEVVKAEKRRDTVTNFALVGILLAVTAGVGYWFYDQYVQEVRLDRQGQRIEGTLDNDCTVTKKEQWRSPLRCTYSFVVGGLTYHGSGIVLTSPRSDQAVIVYDPSNPNNNRIEGNRASSSSWPQSLGLLIVVYLLSGISYLHRKIKSRKTRARRPTA